MKRFAKILSFASVAVLAAATTAHADTIYYNTLTDLTLVPLGGQGFGNTTTILTLHDNSSGVTNQSGCVGMNGSTPQDGVQADCGGEKTLNGAGVLVTAGQEAPPPPNSQKNAAYSFSTLGITNASQVGIIFNGGSAGGDDVTLKDLSIKLYSSTGTLLLDLSDSFAPNAPLPGQGNSGYLIGIDPNAICAIQGNANEKCTSLFNSFYNPNNVLALDASVFDSSGSEEDFQFAKLSSPAPTPEPSSLMLLGTGVLGAAGLLRRRINKAA